MSLIYHGEEEGWAADIHEVIEWARRGLADNGSHWSSELREFLAGKLRGRGEPEAAVDLYWDAFASQPSLAAYRHLLDEAGGDRDDWLQRCQAKLRSVLAGVSHQKADAPAPRLGYGGLPPAVPRTAVALVEILLFEGRIDDAWDAANDYGCQAPMRMTLARAREKTHPLDAIAVYEPEALAIINRKKAAYYGSAVDLMERIRRSADAAGEPDRFTSLLERVRTEHKAKRSLKALLDAKGW